MSAYSFENREISWLSFNHRVLQEAKDPSVPLYERIKFLAIYSSNLDEFFRVRVAGVRKLSQLDKNARKETKEAIAAKPRKLLRQIYQIVSKQQAELGRIFRKEILPELAANGIHLIDNQQLNPKQKIYVKKYFEKEVRSKLQVYPLNKNYKPPFLEDNRIYLALSMRKEGKTHYAILQIPSEITKRFVLLPEEGNKYYVLFLDDVIRFNLKMFFSDYTHIKAFSVKVSRDADLNIEDEFTGNLVEKIKESLANRKTNEESRFLYDEKMPQSFLQQITQILELTKYDLTQGGKYHNFSDFFSFPDPTKNAKLHNELLPPLPHLELDGCDNLLKAIAEKDYMLHFPYQSYKYVSQFIAQASDDELVNAIKITLYRVADDSDIGHALLNALEKGKKVVAFIEVKARFDEASNIYWGEKLEAAGAKVVYSYPGIKVHTKLCLVRRIEEGERRYYTYLGTGNFNEKTARIYADHALLTADKKIGKEASQVFDILERKIIVPKTKLLMISPFDTRIGFTELIDQEIANAKANKDAYIILKMNSLEDQAMIEKIYEANKAGVKIKIICRGICCLVPGIEGQSEHIEVISIVDRFLEHARVYIFGNDGNEKMYLASADWMTRNLDYRIEVAFPICNAELYAELRHIIDLQLKDNVKARIINEEQDNPYKTSRNFATSNIRAQEAIYRYLEGKLKNK